jgi:cysteine dioxygenase
MSDAHFMRDLVRALDAKLAADPRGPGVAGLLETYSREATDWRTYARFQPDVYARNLVRGGEDYELIVICWQDGQRSPIHDHDGQRCWMTVLEGAIRETLFDHPTGAPLAQRSSRALSQGQVSYITDEVGLHEIHPEGGPAVSLHVYAKPIRTCRVFCPDTGRIDQRRLTYHSVLGEPVVGRA